MNAIRAKIFRAVREAAQPYGERTRWAVTASAAERLNCGGINVASTTWEHDIFVEALDKKEKEGVFAKKLNIVSPVVTPLGD